MAACRSTSEWNTPRCRRRRVIAEKKVSTALSHEPEVGVKWKIQRGCRLSQAQHLGVLVGGVVVEDGVDDLAGRHGRLDGVEEAQELLMPVTGHAATDHRAIEDVERGEQRGRAVADIVVGHRPGLARLERQAGLGPIERLDLALLVDRQHHSVARRREVEPDDVLELGDEFRDPWSA